MEDKDCTNDKSDCYEAGNVIGHDDCDYHSDVIDHSNHEKNNFNDESGNVINHFEDVSDGNDDEGDKEDGVDENHGDVGDSTDGNDGNANSDDERKVRKKKRSFDIQLRREEWDSISPTHEAHKLSHGWTEMIESEFTAKNKTCVLISKHNM